MVVKSIKQFKILTILISFLLGAVTLNAVTYEPLPNRPVFRGFSYWLDMADYTNLLQSNMPYQVIQGYIVADSVVRTMPSITYLWDPVKELNLFSDTAQYIYKYWHIMNDYDPVRFYWFLCRKYPEAKNKQRRLQAGMYTRMYNFTELTFVASEYILHIYVNDTICIDTANTDHPNLSEIVVLY